MRLSADTVADPGFWDQVTNLKARIVQFMARYQVLAEKGPVIMASSDADLKRRYQAVMDDGRNMQTQIQRVTSAIEALGRGVDYVVDTVTDWFTDTPTGSQALGAVPVAIAAGAAGVAALSAAIIAWMLSADEIEQDIKLFELRTAEQQRLEATGMTPAAAAIQVDQQIPKRRPDLFESLGTLAMWSALGVGVFIVWRAVA